MKSIGLAFPAIFSRMKYMPNRDKACVHTPCCCHHQMEGDMGTRLAVSLENKLIDS